MTAAELLPHLRGVRKSGDGWVAFCPAHDDRKSPSLSIGERDGKILLHCFAGCPPEALTDALGLSLRDLFIGEDGTFPQSDRHAGGQIVSLRQAFRTPPKRIPMNHVETLHRALLNDAEALAYCTETRRWSREAIAQLKLGLRVDNRGKWLAYPYWRRGECMLLQYRILPAYEHNHQDRFEREAGCESILLNVDALTVHDEVLLASGAADALALLTLGFENVVAVPAGEGSLPASAVDALARKAKVLVCYDNDDAGQKGMRDVARRIGYDRTWVVSLPKGVKDVNEFLTGGGTREAFEEFLAAAVQFDLPSVFSLGQALDKLEEEKTFGAWDRLEEVTPWRAVNRRLREWRPGNLIVVSGPQGVGKTTWTLNVCVHWASRGYLTLLYCLEMTVAELVQHVLCAHYRLAEEQITTAVIARARQELADWPLYLGANPRLTGRKEVLDLLSQAVRRYGLRLVAFDNLHMLARSIEHRAEEVGVLTKGFKLFAMEVEIPLLLLAQPRKLERGQVMTPWDLKDSVDIFSDADQIVLLHREVIGAAKDREAVADAQAGDRDLMSPMTLVRVAKGRHVPTKDAVLFFKGAEHRFRELEPGDSVPGGTSLGRPNVTVHAPQAAAAAVESAPRPLGSSERAGWR